MDIVLALLLAAVLQGEAGNLGEAGMYAVADTMLARMQTPGFPHEWTELLEDYYAEAEPSEEAIAIAARMLTDPWEPGPYLFIYCRHDRQVCGYPRGDKVIQADGLELHLSRSWPGPCYR